MPRKYKKKPGTKSYKVHASEVIENALKDIHDGLSIRKAALKYNISKSVLGRRIRQEKTLKHGGQIALKTEFESELIQNVLVCAEWGYPMDLLDIRLFVKSYLDSKDIKIRRFRQNLPGKDWAMSFISRHRHLTNRVVPNIKRARAEVSHSVINEYFDNLSQTLDGVPPHNILNYDETCFTDNPGEKKYVIRRGCKHPERVVNSTKSSISVMFCAAADGSVLPVYTVYKSTAMLHSWMLNGPPNARYNRSKSGWFDSATFTDWFFKVALRYLRRLPGRKVLIGDNLASHLTKDVIDSCQRNNIAFIFLPPNSTHLTQPLDVSYFAPLKQTWRIVLDEWKTGPGKFQPSLPKDQFPALLKKTLDKIEFDGRGTKNVKSGFEKTGIFPLNRRKVLEQIPESDEIHSTGADSIDDDANVSDRLVNFLKDMRYRPGKRTITRRRKVNVTAGKSVSLSDIEESLSVSPSNDSSDSESSVSEDSNDSEMYTAADLSIDQEESDNDIDDTRNSSSNEVDTENSNVTPKLGSIPPDSWIIVRLDATNPKKVRKPMNADTYVAQVKKVYGNYEFEVKFVTPYRNEPQQFV